MRQLHLVEHRPATDSQAEHLVLATTDSAEQFALDLDAPVREAVRSAPAAIRPAMEVSAEQRVSPREIQVRVRAGETTEQVAEALGSPVEWVARFAAPVLAERARIADEARRARARRTGDDSNGSGQIVVFGETVDARFAAHGIDPETVRWDAHRRDDGVWLVVATWVGGHAEWHARWSFQLSGRMVAPDDETAADLLSDRPIRPLVPPEPEPAALSLAPPLVPGVVAFPVMPGTDTGPLPQEVFDQERHDERHHEQRGVPDSFPVPRPPGAPDAAFDEPVLPMHVPNAPEVTTKIPKVAMSEEERASRSMIPKWDDILLGVRRKRD